MRQNATFSHPIIDSHVHILPPGRLAGLMRWIHRAFKGHPVPADIDSEGILADLRANGTKHFFNLVYPLEPGETESLNEFNHEFCAGHLEAAGWGSLHIENPGKASIVERCIADLGFVGMKFHPFIQRFSITDPRMTPVYETLDALKRPLMIHTGFEYFYQQEMPPSQVEELLRGFPGMPLIAVHCLFPHLEEAFGLLERYPNLTLDLTNVFGAITMAAELTGADALDTPEARVLIAEVPRHSDRLLFGTDHPAGMGTVEKIYRDMRLFGFDAEVARRITFQNAFDLAEKYLQGKWKI
ncbi:MAG: amidohydrolase family protein [bacterium]